jgi:hypothetical protein
MIDDPTGFFSRI